MIQPPKTYRHAVRTMLIAILATAALPGLALAKKADLVVLNEGYVAPIEGREFVPGAKPDGARRVATTVLLIKAEGVVIVADPGMVSAKVDIAAKLKAEGVALEDVTHVFISHQHTDHITQVGLFPNATIVDFWGKYRHDLWEDHPADYEIAPGVKTIQTPGHTDEDASLVVETAKGTIVYTHVWWNERMEPKIDPLAESQKRLEESRKRVLSIADFIIPGHGKMFKNPTR